MLSPWQGCWMTLVVLSPGGKAVSPGKSSEKMPGGKWIGENRAKQDIAQRWAVHRESKSRGERGGFGGTGVLLWACWSDRGVPSCHSGIGQCYLDQSFPGKVRLR